MKIFNKIGACLTFIVIFGVALSILGVICNNIALVLNDGKMPVDIETIHFLESIERHKVKDNTVRGEFFIDRFTIRFPKIEKTNNVIGNFIQEKVYGTYLNYPVEGGLNVVSIGDIMIWIGTSLFLLFLLPLIVIIPFTYFETKNEQ